jgi:putative oxidoreductase
MSGADIRETKLINVASFGLRTAIGVIFIVHGTAKFNPGFVGFLTDTLGFPPEMQIPIALAESTSGILLIAGILSRISASMTSIISLGAIFYVKKAANLTGGGGYELDLSLLAGALVIVVIGPGKVSLAHVIKRLPRYLH